MNKNLTLTDMTVQDLESIKDILQSDFDDFNDLKDDMKATKIIIRILIILIVVAFIVGAVFFLNNFLEIF